MLFSTATNKVTPPVQLHEKVKCRVFFLVGGGDYFLLGFDLIGVVFGGAQLDFC